jgi:hypothetical protein
MSIISAGTSSGTSVVVTGNTDGSLVFNTNNTGSGGTTALTLGADQSVSFGTEGVSAFTGNKNLLINGTGFIFQRQTLIGSSSVATNGYGPDGWRIGGSGGGAFTMDRETTTLPTGFSTGLSLSVSTIDTSIASTDYYRLEQKIGYHDFQHLKWNSASAIPVTLSFWVRSNVAGLYAGGIVDRSNAYSYPFTYTINSANTYEKKTITINPPTGVGNFGSSDGQYSAVLYFDLGSGSNFVGTANGEWQAGEFYRTSASMSTWMNTLSNSFYITGIQLERGTSATSFEQRSFQQELFRCMRLYQKSFLYQTAPAQNAGLDGANIWTQVVGANTAQNGMQVMYPIRMVNTPSFITSYNPSAANTQARNLTAAGDWASTTINNSSAAGFWVSGTSNAGSAAGNAVALHWHAMANYT